MPIRNERGFTLLELMVVLLILGLSASLVGPAFFRSVGSLKLRTTTRELAATLRYARAKSVAKSTVHVVHIKLGHGTEYWMEALEETKPKDEDEFGDGFDMAAFEEEEKIYREMIEERVKVEGDVYISSFTPLGRDPVDEGEVAIRFFPLGNCSGGEIVVQEYEGELMRIWLDTLTGRVKLGEREQGDNLW